MTHRPGRARSVAAGPVTHESPPADAGMVTAEFAVALPAFVLVVIAALCGVAVVTAQLRCADAAAVAARMAARGESAAQVRATALDGAPGSARLEVAVGDQAVTATVRATIAPPGMLSFLPAVTVQSHVVAALEPTSATVSTTAS